MPARKPGSGGRASEEGGALLLASGDLAPIPTAGPDLEAIEVRRLVAPMPHRVEQGLVEDLARRLDTRGSTTSPVSVTVSSTVTFPLRRSFRAASGDGAGSPEIFRGAVTPAPRPALINRNSSPFAPRARVLRHHWHGA